MADLVSNYALGRVVEKIADAASSCAVLLLQANEAESTLVDRDTVADLLAETGTTEATATSYARKTGLTATVLVDTTNDWCDVDIGDQSWSPLGGATNNTLTKLVIAYQNSGTADTLATVLTLHDFAVTTDGSDVTAQVNTEGFFRAT